MTLAQNHRQQLNGNKKYLLLVLLAFVMQSCGVLDGIFGSRTVPPPPPPPPFEEEEVNEPEETETTPIVKEETVFEPEPIDTVIIPTPPIIEKEELNVAIILPFQIEKIEQSNSYLDASKNSIEIYKGIKYALEDVNFTDKELNVFVFDNAGNDVQTQAILNKAPFPDVDVVIGPLYTRSLKVVADYAKANQIYFISPLSSSTSMAENNPYLISSLATTPTRYELLMDFIDKEFINPNVGLFYQPVAKEERAKREILAAATTKEVTVKEQISEGREMFSSINSLLETGRENVILTAVDDNAEGQLYFKQLLTFLNQLGDQYDINVVALREWNDVQQFAPQQYPNLSLYILDRFLDTTNSPKSYEFSNLQVKNQNNPLHIYTIQGYDIMSYLINLMEVHGPDFENQITKSTYTGLQTKYDFGQFKSGSNMQFYDNKYINILQFKNGRWELMN